MPARNQRAESPHVQRASAKRPRRTRAGSGGTAVRPLDFAPLEPRQLMAGSPQVFSTGPGQVQNLFNANELETVNNVLFISAAHPSSGYELFKTDGTYAGTVLVKEIVAGSGHSVPRDLTNVNGTLFFSARDGFANNADVNRELWKSDGTAAGTVRVKELIASATEGSNPDQLLNVNGVLFFTALAESGGNGLGSELWRSDGTAAGTVLVKDIRPGLFSSGIDNMTNVNGTLFFTANDGSGGTELWRSDGTAAGTVRMANIKPGSGSSAPSDLTNVNGTLFFGADDGTGKELWKSGTAVGTTQLVRDLATSPNGITPQELVNVNGTLYFTSGLVGGLWRSNGDSANTVQVTAAPGSSSNLTNVNGTLMFSAFGGTSSRQVWKSDGTSSGTQIAVVTNASPGGAAEKAFFNAAGTLYFVADNLTTGNELWLTDGTLAGTRQLTSIATTGSPNISDFTLANGKLFFVARTDPATPNTRLVWMMDTGGETEITPPGVKTFGVPATDFNSAAVRVAPVMGAGVAGIGVAPPTPPDVVTQISLVGGATSSVPENFTNVNGIVYFTAGQPLSVRKLWRTDGTSAGTFQVPQTGSFTFVDPLNLFNASGRLMFSAEFSQGATPLGRELGFVSPTTGNAQLLRDIRPGSGSSGPTGFTQINGVTFFAANDGANGNELWETRGWFESTVLVKDIATGSGGSDPQSLVNVNGRLFFSANDGVNGRELWRSSGAGLPTVLTGQIAPGAASSDPQALVNVNGTLFFTANNAAEGRELWRAGDSGAPVMAGNIRPGASGSNPTFLTNVKGALLFAADDGSSGRELWKHFAGTSSLVLDIHPGAASSEPSALRNLSGTLLFSANNGSVGRELWRSNSNAAGTTLVKDIRPGANGSDPQGITVFNGFAYFSADDGVTGRELWTSDYSNPSVHQVADIALGAANSSPTLLSRAGATWLAFSATTSGSGRELWVLKNSGSDSAPLAMRPAGNGPDERTGLAPGRRGGSGNRSVGPGANIAKPPMLAGDSDSSGAASGLEAVLAQRGWDATDCAFDGFADADSGPLALLPAG